MLTLPGTDSPSLSAPCAPTLEDVDNKTHVSEFLVNRRGRITPEQAGIATNGAKRRVPGLRREEVAVLARVSVDYYIQLERGNLAGVSDGVLASIGEALQLDDAEQAHLFDLARTANASPATRRKTESQRVRPMLQRLLDSISTPAWVRNSRGDFLAANTLGYALYSPMFHGTARPANAARFTFLDEKAKEFYADWDRMAADIVAVLRAEAGRTPYDKALAGLIGELATRSEEFRVRWASHDIRLHRTGFKRLHHPVVGDLDLNYEAMELPSDNGLTLFAYTVEPGSPSEQALDLLASWTLTERLEQASADAAGRLTP